MYFTGPLVPSEDWLEFTKYNYDPAEGYSRDMPPDTAGSLAERATLPRGWEELREDETR